jgi:ribosomal protein L40E
MVESEKCLRKTSDEAPLRRGGGKNSAPLALLRCRLLFLALVVGGLLLPGLLQVGWAQAPLESTKFDSTSIKLCPRCGKACPVNAGTCRFCKTHLYNLGHRKYPWVSTGMSCILPGSGQFYNQEYTKGCVFMALIGAGMAITPHPTSNEVGAHPEPQWTLGGMLLSMGWAGSVIDAWISAKSINRRRGFEDWTNPADGFVLHSNCRAANPRDASTCWYCGGKLHYHVVKKNPLLATGLSCVVPGAGQWYNGERWKGTVVFALVSYNLVEVLRYEARHPDDRNDTGRTLYQGGWIVGILDAPITATRINRKRVELAQNKPGIGLVFVPDPRNPRRLRPGVGLRAGF